MRKVAANKKARQTAQRTNSEWMGELSDPADPQALADLRAMLIRGLKPALYKYKDRELDQFVEDVTQDALLKILDNLNTFRAESKFFSWAMKIAVREGLSELRHKKWQDISIQDLIFRSGDEESMILLLLEYLKLHSREKDCEIIVVDGQSSDNTCEAVRRAGFTCIRSPQKGRAAQMNLGAEKSEGDTSILSMPTPIRPWISR